LCNRKSSWLTIANLILCLNNLSKFIEENNHIDDDNEKRMTLNDIKELLVHWHEYAKRTDKKSLQQFKDSMALGKTHPLAQKNGITLSTVHTMKGQEGIRYCFPDGHG